MLLVEHIVPPMIPSFPFFSRLTPSYPKPIPLAHQEGLGAVPTGTGDLEQEGDRLSAVLVPRTLILRRQKKLATAKGSGM